MAADDDRVKQREVGAHLHADIHPYIQGNYKYLYDGQLQQMLTLADHPKSQ